VLGAIGLFALLCYLVALSVRPLDANDLFWHLAAGEEILRTGAVPRADPFSFASGGVEWIDHEWLWQVAAVRVYAVPGDGVLREPAGAGLSLLILLGAGIVLSAYAIPLTRLLAQGVPAGAVVLLGLLAAEVGRERMMVRPESASLLMLSLLLALLEWRRPGAVRWLGLVTVGMVWANLHPAVLVAPLLTLLHGVGNGLETGSGGLRPRALGRVLGEGALVAAGTLVNPYGVHLWGVPLRLGGIVRNKTFFNPEWLPPPPLRFPLFFLALGLVVAACARILLRRRGAPLGSLAVALLLGALAAWQMRHMGLFAVAFLFAGGTLLRSLVPERAARRVLPARGLLGAVTITVLLMSVAQFLTTWAAGPSAKLDPGRFPVEACERIAREAPGVRLYNDVRFGGYLIWRFYPAQQVFIDGRNEVYPELLTRLGRIHTGETPYSEWRTLISGLGIGGAIVRYQETRKGVIYAPERPGEEPKRGYRAWSAYLFPPSEWALVYFDDSALVFMKRGGTGQAWIDRGEYAALNPEDGDYVLELAASDPAFDEKLRADLHRRMAQAPPSTRVHALLEALESRRAIVPSRN
jgi:hypothetical protein